MQVTIDNVNYKFIPSKMDTISKKDLVLKNDVYEKYNATVKLDGELIICNDVNQFRPSEKKIIRETYNDYLKYIKYRDPRKDQWIYNIINGKWIDITPSYQELYNMCLSMKTSWLFKHPIPLM